MNRWTDGRVYPSSPNLLPWYFTCPVLATSSSLLHHHHFTVFRNVISFCVLIFVSSLPFHRFFVTSSSHCHQCRLVSVLHDHRFAVPLILFPAASYQSVSCQCLCLAHPPPLPNLTATTTTVASCQYSPHRFAVSSKLSHSAAISHAALSTSGHLLLVLSVLRVQAVSLPLLDIITVPPFLTPCLLWSHFRHFLAFPTS